jgi:FKBP-type peptidyl-prolyl cis-trans isomerase SlpA
MAVIGTDSEVTLHFRLSLESGELVDSTFERQPGTFVMGDETLPSGITKLLLGLKSGDKRAFVVKPEQAFGPHNEKNVQQMPRSQFDADQELADGLVVQFQGPGGTLPGIVRRATETVVTVDFNHPLAGRTLLFDVEIVDVGVAPQAVQIQMPRS